MKKKIIYMNSLPNFGGGEKHLLNLIRELQKENTFSITVACPRRSPLAEELSKLRVRTFPVPLKSKFDFRSILMLQGFMRRERFDIIHTEDVRSNLLGTIAAVMAKVPIVIWTIHMLSINRSISGMNPIKRRIWISVDRMLVRYVDKIIAISEFNRRELIKKEKIEPGKIVVIPSSIRLNEFSKELGFNKKRKEFGIEEGEKVVGYIGRLSHQKGLTYLLEAARMVSQIMPIVKFLIVGDGPQKIELEEKVKELNITGNVALADFRKDVNELYPIFDITVLPSLYEGLPVVPMESMVYGKPVVATTVGGVPEVVIDGETGLLVPPGDVKSLAKAILKLIQDDASRKEMSRKGKDLIKKKYSNEQMVKAHKSLYEELVRSKGVIR